MKIERSRWYYTMFNQENVKYILRQVKNHWKSLHWWRDRFITYIVGTIVNKYWERKYPKGKILSIMEEDWDNLIILDACRYDIFCEIYGKKVDYRISQGSNTLEFLQKNFAGKRFTDIVYITANPFVDRICKKSFYKVISVWKDGWDDDLGTVPPDVVVEYALEAENKYPDKRFIIHFIQPHYPYIGYNVDWKPYLKDFLEEMKKGKNIRDGDLTKLFKLKTKEMIMAYKRNLKIVLPYALKLTKKLEGKTVITSDHGEAFGELAYPLPIRIYCHPPNVHIPALVKIPWLVFETKGRKQINVYNEKRRVKEHIRKLKEENKI